MKLLRQYLHKISISSEHNVREFLLDLLTYNPEATMLDIGCGKGEFSELLTSKVRVEKLYAIELFSKYAYEASKKGLSIIVADIDIGLPFRDSSFHTVVSNQVLEHVNNTDKFISESYRVLKNEGLLIISTPNLAGIYNIISLIFGFQPTSTAVSDKIVCGNPLDPFNGHQVSKYRRHRRVFTAYSLKALLEYYGFCIKLITGIGLHPLPSFISKHIKFVRYSNSLVAIAVKSEPSNLNHRQATRKDI